MGDFFPEHFTDDLTFVNCKGYREFTFEGKLTGTNARRSSSPDRLTPIDIV